MENFVNKVNGSTRGGAPIIVSVASEYEISHDYWDFEPISFRPLAPCLVVTSESREKGMIDFKN